MSEVWLPLVAAAGPLLRMRVDQALSAVARGELKGKRFGAEVYVSRASVLERRRLERVNGRRTGA